MNARTALRRPLLSVAVYTYAQERFVRETLDSLLPGDGETAAAETTEIVVSDDRSPDGTADVVASWMERNGRFFHSCRLLRGETNEGPVRNYVRAVRACSGEIVKPIAGDDLFCPGSLGFMQTAMERDPDIPIAFGKVIGFSDRPEGAAPEWTREQRRLFGADAGAQFRMLVSADPLQAPGVFFKKSLFEELRLWDYPFFWMEDWPLWLLATAHGRRIVGLDVPLVYYRRHPASISQKMNVAGRERIRKGINGDRKTMYDRIVLPREASLPFWLRHHVRLRRFFFGLLETTRHPALVHAMRELSLLIDPHRLYGKVLAFFQK